MRRDATIDGVYRYTLRRGWGDNPPCVFVMLNPSTADADHDDPTIRRCLGFARAWGYDQLEVVNVYAYRSTDPKALRRVGEARHGPGNFAALCQAAARAGVVVAAWGANVLPEDAERVGSLLAQYGPVMCIGTTRGGQPRHPLYAPKSSQLVEWRSVEVTR